MDSVMGDLNWTATTPVTVTSNATSSHIEHLQLAEVIVFSGIFVLISVAGVVGNGLVVVAIAGDSKMRKSTMNALLLNLACADLCNVIICIPQFIFQLLNRGWLMPFELCALFRFAERVFLYTSLLTQLAVGIERFYAITYPMKVHLLCSRRKVIWWAVFLWMIAMAASSPYAVWSEIKQNWRTGHAYCIWGAKLSVYTKLTLRTSECVIFYFVPLVLIVVLYSFVSAKLWSRDHQLHEGRSDSGPSETLKTRQSVVKMLIVCICVYFICYSPIQAILISTVLFGKTVRFGMSAELALHFLAYSCSAANPIVYTLYSHRFRRKFAQLLCCRRGGYERTTTTGTTTANSSWVTNHFSNNGNASSPHLKPVVVVKNGEEATGYCELTSRLMDGSPASRPLRGSPSHRHGDSFRKYGSSPSLTAASLVSAPAGKARKTVLCTSNAVLRKVEK